MAHRINSSTSSTHSFELDRGWSMIENPEFSVHNFRDPSELQYQREEEISNRSHESINGFEYVRKSCIKDSRDSAGITENVSKEQGTSTHHTTLSQDQPGGSVNHHEKSASLPHPMPADLSEEGTINARHIYNSFPSLPTSDDGGDSDQNDSNIKTSLMSVWNNMKNGFTVQMKTNFKYDSPIWVLGCLYHCTREDRDIQKEKHEAGQHCITSMDEFKNDFASRIWFTYRKDFQRLPFSQLTTDMGWGCMLRSSQMMLAQALVMHLLGRSWRYSIHRNPKDLVTHRRIIKLFSDIDSAEAVLSIHNLVKIGKNYGKNPGDWYGPSSVAFVLRDVVQRLSESPVVSDLCLYVAQDCTLYKDDLLDLCTGSGGSSISPQNRETGGNSWRSVIVLIPVRLGGLSFNPVYQPCLKAMLAHKHCIGIIGGKPKHSLYFVGWQEEKLIYLDPHFCQDFVDTKDQLFPIDTFHCKSPRKVSFSKMDPSCTIGFYCKTREDLDTFLREVPKLSIPPLEASPHPMFVFQDGRSERGQLEDDPNATERILKVQHYDSEGRRRPMKDSDDFVLL